MVFKALILDIDVDESGVSPLGLGGIEDGLLFVSSSQRAEQVAPV